MENFIVFSIETHLFFARIMREHALFLEAGFPCRDEAWIRQADWYRQQFEHLLRETVQLANGRIGTEIIESGELVTEFTIPAERSTSRLSGIPIDSRISAAEQKLRAGCTRKESRQLVQTVQRLNERALQLLDGLIAYKERLLREVKQGRLFNANYPLLIEHIIREAKLYRETVWQLQQNREISFRNICDTENFWNRIMMEHALFIRGLLDPSEEELVAAADGFAADYRELLTQAKRQDCRAMHELTQKSLEETLEYRKFKTAGAEGILKHEIASILLPLLADHVLREANHYIRLLECENRLRGCAEWN